MKSGCPTFVRVFPLIVLLTLAGCQTSAESTVAWVPDGEELLGVSITNQSFERPSVELTVQIDGEKAIADTYLVENQHEVHYYELEVAGGTRTVTVVSEHGEQATIEVEAGGNEPWLYIAYWGTEANESFNLRTEPEQPAIA